MKFRNPWFEWMSFLAGVLLLGAAWGAMRDYWRSERDFSEAAIIAAVEILLAIGAFWVSLRWGRNQKRVREWRWDEGMKDTAEK